WTSTRKNPKLRKLTKFSNQRLKPLEIYFRLGNHENLYDGARTGTRQTYRAICEHRYVFSTFGKFERIRGGDPRIESVTRAKTPKNLGFFGGEGSVDAGKIVEN